MSRPDFTAPRFEGCYRHPDRTTGIRCQRCGRPICGECMNPASVGFQCPECSRAGRSTARPRRPFAGALSARGGLATKILLGTVIGLYVLGLISAGRISRLLAMSNLLVLDGQYWRLLTYGFTSVGIFNTAMIALVLWLVGRPLEQMLGGPRLAVLYALSGFGGATLLYVVGPPGLGGLGGASAAVIGLLAVNGVIKYRRHEDFRPDIGLLAILVLLNLVVGFGGLGWVAQIGGILVGGASGVALTYPGRTRRPVVPLVGLLAVVAVCVAAVVVKTLLSYGIV